MTVNYGPMPHVSTWATTLMTTSATLVICGFVKSVTCLADPPASSQKNPTQSSVNRTTLTSQMSHMATLFSAPKVTPSPTYHLLLDLQAHHFTPPVPLILDHQILITYMYCNLISTASKHYKSSRTKPSFHQSQRHNWL